MVYLYIEIPSILSLDSDALQNLELFKGINFDKFWKIIFVYAYLLL